MRSKSTVRHLWWVLPALVAAVAVACGGSTVKSPTAATNPESASGSTPGTGPAPGAGPQGTGTLTILLKDSPFSEASALLVSFSDVSVHMSGGGWVTLPFAEGAVSRTCDLKKLEDATDVLGVGTLTAGHYTQIRLTVSSATLYFLPASATPGLDACAPAITVLPSIEIGTPIDVPSGELKLNREFDVAGTETTITLDFDGDKSVHQTGNGKYKMTPVIGVVSVQ